MKLLCLRKKRIMFSVLCAALALLTAVQSTAAPYNTVYAAESSTTDESNNAVGGKVLDDVLGEIIFYRWERFNGNNYPKDNKWHPLLTLWGASRSKVLNPAAPSEIYLQDAHAVIEGAKWFGRDGNGIFPLSDYNDRRFSSYKGTNLNVDPNGAAALKAHDTANYQELKDGINKNVFYTTSNYNCTFARYGGIEEYTKCPYFMIGISNGKDAAATSLMSTKSDYIINLPNGAEKASSAQKSGQMKLTKENERVASYENIVFQNDGKGQYHIYDYNTSDPSVYLVLQDNFFIGESKFDFGGGYFNDQFTADAETADIYFGEAFRYSAVMEDTTVGSGQILSISANDYVDAKGDIQSQNGVMIPNGKTLTIEKGGVLSISGDLINNGTIINKGGTILIKKGGNVYPFRSGSTPSKNGCGTIKCLGGDIIIKEGGALYAGMNDEVGNIVPFYMDENSTLINQGLLVYGAMRLGEGARVECYDNSKTYGSWFMGNFKESATDMSKLTYSQKQTVLKAFDEHGFSYIYDEKANIVTSWKLAPTEQLDMLPKYSSYFLNNNTGSLSGQLAKASITAKPGTQGAYLPDKISDAGKPHYLVSSSALLDDNHFDKRLKTETLTI
ncbi:hypothetical protein [Ruminococcus sp. FC2018]|uniref:hypothetical protein n=1 Tax=Ruminococcus sp. FC2018 TaxID=1410617 RepID=UPI00048DCDE2|nr:hypothetical protein [Ruminococcus sp. FC2018]